MKSTEWVFVVGIIIGVGILFGEIISDFIKQSPNLMTIGIVVLGISAFGYQITANERDKTDGRKTSERKTTDRGE